MSVQFTIISAFLNDWKHSQNVGGNWENFGHILNLWVTDLPVWEAEEHSGLKGWGPESELWVWILLTENFY